MKLKCKFGTPQHGWLPVLITFADFRLEMDVSDVPVNPIDRLTSSLNQALNGIESEVWWHLEPASYYFNFAPKGNDEYKFSISSSTSNAASDRRKPVFDASGKRDEIIMPFWKAIKEFSTHTYKEPDWPPIDEREFDKLTMLLKSKQ